MYMYHYIRTHIPAARARARASGTGSPTPERSGLTSLAQRPSGSCPKSAAILAGDAVASWRKGASADGFTCAYDLAGSLPVWSEEIHGIHKQDTLSLGRALAPPHPLSSSPFSPSLRRRRPRASISLLSSDVGVVVDLGNGRGGRERGREDALDVTATRRRARNVNCHSGCQPVGASPESGEEKYWEKEKDSLETTALWLSRASKCPLAYPSKASDVTRVGACEVSPPETRVDGTSDDAKLATTLRPRRLLSRVDGRRSARARRRKRNGADVRETTRRVLHSPRRRGRDEYTRRKERETRALARGRTSRARSPPFLLEDGRAIARARDRHGYESWPLWPWHWTCGRRAGEGGTRAADKPAPAEGSAAEWGDAAESRRNVGLGRGVGGGRTEREGGREAEGPRDVAGGRLRHLAQAWTPRVNTAETRLPGPYGLTFPLAYIHVRTCVFAYVCIYDCPYLFIFLHVERAL